MMSLNYYLHRPEPIPSEPGYDPLSEPQPDDAPGAVPPIDDDEGKDDPLE